MLGGYTAAEIKDEPDENKIKEHAEQFLKTNYGEGKLPHKCNVNLVEVNNFEKQVNEH